MIDFINSFTLLLVLLNPFLIIIYLTDLVQKLDLKSFSKVLFRASLITAVVYSTFAWVGDVAFSKYMQVNFASFQIFGGIVFILIGIQFVFKGTDAIEMLRGDAENLAGAIAMPVLIGPGTLSASVIVGEKLSPSLAVLAIILALGSSMVLMIGLKWLHDYVRPRNEPLIRHYIQIAGRITALFVGTYSVEMIMRGLQSWAVTF
ncbi:MAG: MarC family protein [Kiritimatiellae bacterium]|jgi:multiple antibiotic resistance protein|nr:MarC family protein [Kiritimatiellia bacterium]